MVNVRIELYRPTTESHLTFVMRVKEGNVDRLPEYIDLQYPDWILQSIVRKP